MSNPSVYINAPRDYAGFAALRWSPQIHAVRPAHTVHLLKTRHRFLSRPRRFGKTLLLSTLKCLFARHARRGRADTCLALSDTLPVIEFRSGQSARMAVVPWRHRGYRQEFPLRHPARTGVGTGLHFDTPKRQGGAQWDPDRDSWERIYLSAASLESEA